MIEEKEFLIDPLKKSRSLADLDTSLRIAGYSEINKANLERSETREYRIGFILSLIAKLVNHFGLSECEYGEYFLKHDDPPIEYYSKGIKILLVEFDRENEPYYLLEDIDFMSDNEGKLRIRKILADFEGYLQSVMKESKACGITDLSSWNFCGAEQLNTLITRQIVRTDGLGTAIISWFLSVIKKERERNYTKVLGFYTVRGTRQNFKDITGFEWSEDLDS